MKIKYDNKRMSKLVKTKRVIDLDLNMRQTAKKLGISIATLSRIENGKHPDIETMAIVCDWIKEPMDSFFIKKQTQNT